MENKNLKLALICFVPAAIIAAVVVFFLVGGSSKAYMETVPSNSLMVAKVNVGALINKSAVMENDEVVGKLEELIEDAPDNVKGILEELLSDLNATGIDIEQPAVFAFGVEDEEPFGVLTLAMTDAEKLCQVLDDIFEGELEIEETDGIFEIVAGKDVAIAFDNEKLVVSFADNNADAIRYFELESDEKAVNDSNFNEFFANESDAVMFVQFAPIMDAVDETELSRSEKKIFEIVENFRDLKYFAYVNFGDGCIEGYQRLNTEEGKNSLQFFFDFVFDNMSELTNVFLNYSPYGYDY